MEQRLRDVSWNARTEEEAWRRAGQIPFQPLCRVSIVSHCLIGLALFRLVSAVCRSCAADGGARPERQSALDTHAAVRHARFSAVCAEGRDQRRSLWPLAAARSWHGWRRQNKTVRRACLQLQTQGRAASSQPLSLRDWCQTAVEGAISVLEKSLCRARHVSLQPRWLGAS